MVNDDRVLMMNDDRNYILLNHNIIQLNAVHRQVNNWDRITYDKILLLENINSPVFVLVLSKLTVRVSPFV